MLYTAYKSSIIYNSNIVVSEKHLEVLRDKSTSKKVKEQKTLVTGSFYTVSEGRQYLELEGHREL